MQVQKFILAIASSFFVLIAAAYADNGGWRVVETSGAVRISQTMAGVQLVSTGETLRGGSILSTGLDGRAVLARGEQTIVVGPNSRMSLPAIEEEGMTRILQDLGTLMFKVDKKEKQHFKVETPVIAAVVKGTTFTVTAGSYSHAVHVAEGLVEVTPIDSANSVLVPAGETVQVSTASHTFIQPESGSDDGPAPAQQEIEPAGGEKHAELMLIPTDIGVDPLDYANLSDGLVRDDAPNAVGAAARESQSPVFEANNARDADAVNPRAVAAIAGNGAGNGLGNGGNAAGLGNSNNGNGLGLGLGNGNSGAGGGNSGNGLGLGNSGGNNGNGLGLGNGGGNNGNGLGLGGANGGNNNPGNNGVGNGLGLGVGNGAGNGGGNGQGLGLGNSGGSSGNPGAGNNGSGLGLGNAGGANGNGGADVSGNVGNNGNGAGLGLGLGNGNGGGNGSGNNGAGLGNVGAAVNLNADGVDIIVDVGNGAGLGLGNGNGNGNNGNGRGRSDRR